MGSVRSPKWRERDELMWKWTQAQTRGREGTTMIINIFNTIIEGQSRDFMCIDGHELIAGFDCTVLFGEDEDSAYFFAVFFKYSSHWFRQ